MHIIEEFSNVCVDKFESEFSLKLPLIAAYQFKFQKCGAVISGQFSYKHPPKHPLARPFMMTSSNGNIFRVTGHLCGEFTGPGEFPAQRPVTRSFDVFFDLRLNKLLSKQWWGWWLGTLSRPLWRHRNVGRSMACLLLVHHLFDILPQFLQSFIHYWPYWTALWRHWSVCIYLYIIHDNRKEARHRCLYVYMLMFVKRRTVYSNNFKCSMHFHELRG